jgi:hypothetical protein
MDGVRAEGESAIAPVLGKAIRPIQVSNIRVDGGLRAARSSRDVIDPADLLIDRLRQLDLTSGSPVGT